MVHFVKEEHHTVTLYAVRVKMHTEVLLVILRRTKYTSVVINTIKIKFLTNDWKRSIFYLIVAKIKTRFFSYTESQCVRVWDNVMCWPPTPAGQLAILPCPSHIRNIDTSRKSTSGHSCLEWLDQCETFPILFFIELPFFFTFDIFYGLIEFLQSEYPYSSFDF